MINFHKFCVSMLVTASAANLSIIVTLQGTVHMANPVISANIIITSTMPLYVLKYYARAPLCVLHVEASLCASTEQLDIE